MGTLLSDGSVLSSKVPRGLARAGRHYALYGIYRGIVRDVIYPDDVRGDSIRYAVQYQVQVRGQMYYNARDLRRWGGIFDYDLVIRKPTEFPANADNRQPDQLLDGDPVLVMFEEGNADLPVIVGSSPHVRAAEYPAQRTTRAQGRRRVQEFNGVEVSVDATGSYQIKIVGRKSDDKGTLANQGAVGALIRIDGTTGAVTVQDSNGNSVQLAQNLVSVTCQKDLTATVPGKCTLTVTGDLDANVQGNANILAQGNAEVKGTQITLKSPNNTVAAGAMVCVNAQNNDPITGIPLVGVGGVTAST